MYSPALSFRRSLVWVALLLGALLVAGCGGNGGTMLPAGAYTPTAGAVPKFSHVFVIVMENHSYGDIIGNDDAPYINSLAKSYGLLTRYYAITHPSLPNYLALTGGQTFGVTSDCTDCYVSGTNLADALEARGKSWRAYMESMPSPCYQGDAYPYAQKHDPFYYFDDIRTNAARCQHIVPLDGLGNDLASGSAPDFIWITPNLCDDMHDCPTRMGDNWLSQEVPQILASSAWKHGGALFLTWDESDGTNDGCCSYAAGGQVATLVISPLVKAGARSNTPYDHYSLLRTISAAWGLTPPGHADDPATAAITDIWR